MSNEFIYVLPKTSLKTQVEEYSLEVVDELKLLGVQVKSDLKWSNKTAYFTKTRYGKPWMIRKQRAAKANREELCDIYCKHVRSILEYASVVWHSSLTIEITAYIERV